MKYIAQPVIDGATNFPGQNPQKMYSITSINSGLVASLNGNAVELVQKNWKEDPAQQWRFEPLSGQNSGYYRIVSMVNGKVMSLQGDTGVIVDAWKDAPLGQWKLINLGYGKFKIESRANGGILDVVGSSMSEGAKINLYKPGARTTLKAVIYEHANYQGRSQEMGLGKYDINHLTIGNDVLSSLKVPKGLRVTLYEHAGFQGRSKSLTADTAYVGNDFNDITSSIVVEEDGKSVTIYEHGDYQGRSQTLGVGKHDMGSLFGNDILSSLKVPNGFVVTIFEHAGFQGRSKSFTADTAYVGNDFNDMASSIVVDYKEGTSLSQQWLLAEIVVNKLESTYNKKAIIYEHANYQGRSQEIGPGSYLLKDLKIGNDFLSSLKVPQGIKVTLYEHENFRGREKSFTEDTAYVGNDFNDITSSILVEPVVTVYQHVNYEGAKQMIGVGNHNMNDLSFGNDQISSIKVPQGFIATLYEHADYNGRTKTFLEDAAYVGDDFNDKTSSIMVKAMGVVIPDDALKFGSVIALKSFHGKYLSADPNGTLKANVDWSKDWEHYTIVRSGATKNKTYLSYGDVVSLKSFHGKFFTAAPDGKCAFDSNSTNEGQQFVLVRAGTTKDMSFVTPGDTIGLKSHYNKYMSAWPDGRCAVDKDWIKEWEHWTIAGISTPPETGPGACGAAACAAAGCAADYCGTAACAAAAGLFSACGVAGAVVAVCGANMAGIAGCVVAAYGAAVVGIAGCAADTCGAAACGAAICGAAAGGISACGANACGAAACAAAACGGAACGAAACGGDACPAAVSGADACAAEASAVEACGADACAANVCAINACPADACAADACAIDVIPIIPFI